MGIKFNPSIFMKDDTPAIFFQNLYEVSYCIIYSQFQLCKKLEQVHISITGNTALSIINFKIFTYNIINAPSFSLFFFNQSLEFY
jgi:hypothetical protein